MRYFYDYKIVRNKKGLGHVWCLQNFRNVALFHSEIMYLPQYVNIARPIFFMNIDVQIRRSICQLPF